MPVNSHLCIIDKKKNLRNHDTLFARFDEFFSTTRARAVRLSFLLPPCSK